MKRLLSLLIILCCLSWHTSAESGMTMKRRMTTGYFATVTTLTVYDDFSDPAALEKYDELWQEVKALLERIEGEISLTVPTSEIARFNMLEYGDFMTVCAETAEILRLARSLWEKTKGYYDPTVFPLVDLWAFSGRFTYSWEAVQPYDRDLSQGFTPPEDEYRQAFLDLVDFSGIVLTGDADTGYTLTKNIPPVTVRGVVYQAQIDLGGIAKGYVTDLVTEMMTRLGYTYGSISCGSSSMGLLHTASASAQAAGDSRYTLGVRKPRVTENVADSAYAYVRVADTSLSSSGDYDRNYQLDGQIYCHIIDPFTGYPMNVTPGGTQEGICTVTLLSGSAAEDDALTTALCLMGLEQAIDYINTELQDRKVMFVLYSARQEVYEVVTNLTEEEMTISDSAYVMASRTDETGKLYYTGELFGKP